MALFCCRRAKVKCLIEGEASLIAAVEALPEAVSYDRVTKVLSVGGREIGPGSAAAWNFSIRTISGVRWRNMKESEGGPPQSTSLSRDAAVGWLCQASSILSLACFSLRDGR